MKFRQFEFRLFPKIKNKKKKKPKLGHADFPRDISLDKNSNFRKSGIPQFYDNLAVDANFQDKLPVEIFYKQKYNSSNFVSCHNACYSCCDLKKSSLSDLEINVIGSTCSCDICACVPEADSQSLMTRSCTLAGFNGGSQVGTPSTIQRTRTRIKTNPWLPSPRATPSPSPTDHQQPGTPWTKGNNSDEYSDVQVSRPNDLPLTRSTDRSIAPKINPHSDIMLLNDSVITNDCYSTINVELIDSCVESFITNNSQQNFNEVPADDHIKDDNCDEARSNSSSPVVEFLTCVKYQINFDYEDDVDERLETSSIPRRDSFQSGHFLADTNFETDETYKKRETYKLSADYSLESTDCCYATPDVETNDVTFDDTCNNMQESIDTGYGSGTRDSECLSSDDADDEMSGEFDQIKQSDSEKELFKHHNGLLISKHKVMNDLDGNSDLTSDEKDSSLRDHDKTSDNEQISDLEWDNEPITQTLLADFPHNENNVRHEVEEFSDMNNLSIAVAEDTKHHLASRDYNSVKYRKRHEKLTDDACICRRRRSRSLADIELSLEDKVTLLREEKTFVQRKVHEAIVEDRIRAHQMKIFRLLSGDQRKQLIMKTLYDLKTRLEDQSARLQASYSTVLSLKKMFTHRHTSPVSLDDNQELFASED
ncbi:hypothetical protein ACF0H5_022527 [Mactra antiquata]